MQRYLDLIESADRTTPTGFDVKTVRLYGKSEVLRQPLRGLKQTSRQLQDKPDKQLSMTDPDARSMSTNGRGSDIERFSIRAAASLICCLSPRPKPERFAL